MDPTRFKEAYTRLDLLDDRLSYRIRTKSTRSRVAPGIEQLDERVKDLAEYTLELKEVLKELMLSIASKPDD